jgi:hypothetical protein
MKGNEAMTDQRKIEALTADAIKKSILQVAEDMRAMAKQAKERAAQLEAEADELSQSVIKDVTSLANSVAGLLDNCRAASEAMREHRGLLAKLPAPIDRPADRADDEGIAALNNLAGQLGSEFPAAEGLKVPKAVKATDALVARQR